MLMVLVDPYDSGRLGLLGIRGTDDAFPSTAKVSQARDPQFDSAIFGNSTGQLIRPDALSKATGKQFVQLVIPGSPPAGQLAVLEFFLRHHTHAGSLVVVIDDPWCARSSAPAPDDVFPYWLYGYSTLRYMRHLLNWKAVELAGRRIKIGLGWGTRNREDGFDDYERALPAGKHQPDETPRSQSSQYHGPVNHLFPYKDSLWSVIDRLAPDVGLVLVVPPNFHTILPVPGAREAREREACNAAFRALIDGRPGSNLIDYRIDNDLTRDPKNFVDLIHYRSEIARQIEAGIIASLTWGQAAQINF